MTTLHFLPGASGDPKFWLPVAKQLKRPYYLQHYPAFAGYSNETNIQNFSQLSNWVLDQITHPSILIAQSMGGIFAIQAALQKPHLIKALILCATSGGIDLSSFKVRDWRSNYQQDLPNVPPWFIDANYDYASELNKIKIPILLLWGDTDEISPLSIGLHLQRQLTDAQLNIIPNGKHDFAHIHSELVTQKIQQFLASNSSIDKSI